MSNLAPEPEFEQALYEITSTLEPLLKKKPEYRRALEVVQIPERIISFRVTWERDDGSVAVNRVTESSSTLPSVHTRVVSDCTPLSTCPS